MSSTSAALSRIPTRMPATVSNTRRGLASRENPRVVIATVTAMSGSS
jgi:hypothetical protein